VTALPLQQLPLSRLGSGEVHSPHVPSARWKTIAMTGTERFDLSRSQS
jgi:hypothetical protein